MTPVYVIRWFINYDNRQEIVVLYKFPRNMVAQFHMKEEFVVHNNKSMYLPVLQHLKVAFSENVSGLGFTIQQLHTYI